MPGRKGKDVVPAPGGGWNVKTPRRSQPDSNHRTQKAAEQSAKRALGRQGGGEVRIMAWTGSSGTPIRSHQGKTHTHPGTSSTDPAEQPEEGRWR